MIWNSTNSIEQTGDMPSNELATCTIKPAKGKISTKIDGEIVMMDIEQGAYSSFNSVGSHI